MVGEEAQMVPWIRRIYIALAMCGPALAHAQDDELIRHPKDIASEELDALYHPHMFTWEGAGPVRNLKGRRVSPMKFATALQDFDTVKQIRRQRLLLKLGTFGVGIGMGGVGIGIAGVAGIGMLAFFDGILWLATMGQHEFIFIGPWMQDAFVVLGQVSLYSSYVVLGSLPVIGVGALLAIPTRDLREWYTPEEIEDGVQRHNERLVRQAAWASPKLYIGPTRMALAWEF
jgi:hypothetical protein